MRSELIALAGLGLLGLLAGCTSSDELAGRPISASVFIGEPAPPTQGCARRATDSVSVVGYALQNGSTICVTSEGLPPTVRVVWYVNDDAVGAARYNACSWAREGASGLNGRFRSESYYNPDHGMYLFAGHGASNAESVRLRTVSGKEVLLKTVSVPGVSDRYAFAQLDEEFDRTIGATGHDAHGAVAIAPPTGGVVTSEESAAACTALVDSLKGTQN
jgi:hypothetical protein